VQWPGRARGHGIAAAQPIGRPSQLASHPHARLEPALVALARPSRQWPVRPVPASDRHELAPELSLESTVSRHVVNLQATTGAQRHGLPVEEVVGTQRMPVGHAGPAPEVHGALVVGEQAHGEHVAVTVTHAEREDRIRLAEHGEELPRVRAWKRRGHALPAHQCDVLIEVLLDHGRVVGVLDGQPCPLGVADAIAAGRVQRPPHGVGVGRERHEICVVRDGLVPRRGQRRHGEVRVLQLDHGEPLASRKVAERPHQRGLIHAGLEQRPHEVGAPALERAPQDAERAASQDAATEVPHGAGAFTDGPEPHLDPPARGQVVEPDPAVEQPARVVRGDELIPAGHVGSVERHQRVAGAVGAGGRCRLGRDVHACVPTRNAR
jgi:hypothetical protein